MNPIALAAQALIAALDVYRAVANKPKTWMPDAEFWERQRAFARRTPEQIKAEAAAALPPHHD